MKIAIIVILLCLSLPGFGLAQSEKSIREAIPFDRNFSHKEFDKLLIADRDSLIGAVILFRKQYFPASEINRLNREYKIQSISVLPAPDSLLSKSKISKVIVLKEKKE